MGRKPKDIRELNCKEIMTVTETAKFLQIRRETVLRLIANKKLIATKIGRPWRIRKCDLDTYLKNNENTKEKAKASR